MRSVTHLFDDYAQAKNAVAALEQAGFTSSEVSVISRYRDDGTLADEPSNAGTGAAVGALAGGGTGLLAALGIIAIPGIGPLVAAGVLATTLVGAPERPEPATSNGPGGTVVRAVRDLHLPS